MTMHHWRKRAVEAEAKLDKLFYSLSHGGVQIDTLNITNTEACIQGTARKLGYVLVTRQVNGQNAVTVHAVKL